MSLKTPKIIEGIKCYAPDLAFNSEDFPGEGFGTLYAAEDRTFWFRSRNRIIQNLVARYLTKTSARFLEIGCGTGYVLKGLAALPNLTLTGADIHLQGLRFARQRLPQIELLQLDLSDWSLPNIYDAIGAFDVLEHIAADEHVLRQAYDALSPEGFFFLTVPQHAFLWSAVDAASGHKRRYSRDQLVGKIRQAGFTIRFVSSFVCTLFPLLCLSRLNPLKRHQHTADKPSSTELQPPRLLDALLENAMRWDERWIARGRSLPFGGSLCVVAQKNL